MRKKFMIFVIDDLSGSGTPDEMRAIDAFNDGLRAVYFSFAAILWISAACPSC